MLYIQISASNFKVRAVWFDKPQVGVVSDDVQSECGTRKGLTKGSGYIHCMDFYRVID